MLVGYSGRITSISSLLPDNGLAGLAGALNAVGVKPKIMDLSTIDSLRRMTPTECTEKLQSILRTLQYVNQHRWNPFSLIKGVLAMRDLKAVDAALKKAQERFVREKAEEIIADAKREGYGFIGFKLWNGDGFEGTVMMAEMVKKALPDIKIFFGGPQAQFFRERIYRFAPSVDAIAISDGEKNIQDLMEFVYEGRKLSSINGIIYRDSTGNIVSTPIRWEADMRALPLPDYSRETYPSLYNNEKISIFVVEDIRGCNNGCSFCVIPHLCGGLMRPKGDERTADEIEQIVSETGSHMIRRGGAASTSASLIGSMEELNRRGIWTNSSSFGRINDMSNLTPAQFQFLKDSGLVALFYGVEAESDEKLKLMNKKLTVSATEDTIKKTRDAGIMVAGSIIYPNSYDTLTTRRRLVDMIKRTGIDSVLLQFLGVYPGTAVALTPERFGVEIVYPSWLDNLKVLLGLKRKPSYYDDEIQDYLITYKIKTQVLPKYWEPLPWKINGMSYRRYADETTSLYREILSGGTAMKLTDEEILMAKCAGIPLMEMSSMCFEAAFTSGWQLYKKMLQMINQGVSKRIL